ncbi:MAG TPA: hypothetical protein VHB02_05470 [Acidimicrobiales bacterium]|nr:hypothetical protein [Acidimicrobiales bacterium]
MNTLVPVARNLPAQRTSKVTSRALARISEGTDVSLALIDHQVEVATSKVDAVLQVGGHAAQGVALLKHLQGQLETTVPGCGNEVSFVVDRTVLAAGGLVTDLASQLRRVR